MAARRPWPLFYPVNSTSSNSARYKNPPSFPSPEEGWRENFGDAGENNGGYQPPTVTTKERCRCDDQLSCSMLQGLKIKRSDGYRMWRHEIWWKWFVEIMFSSSPGSSLPSLVRRFARSWLSFRRSFRYHCCVCHLMHRSQTRQNQ